MSPSHPGKILKRMYMEPLNLSIVEVARNLGVTDENLSMLLNGRQRVGEEMALRLADLFDTTPKYFLINIMEIRLSFISI